MCFYASFRCPGGCGAGRRTLVDFGGGTMFGYALEDVELVSARDGLEFAKVPNREKSFSS